jgi:hypothetical protein
VIRRVFWLTLGAAGGIMGYRRLARLSRRSVARDTVRATRMTRGVRGISGFSRDVREGMDLYSARRPRAIGSTLPPKQQRRNVKDDR